MHSNVGMKAIPWPNEMQTRPNELIKKLEGRKSRPDGPMSNRPTSCGEQRSKLITCKKA